MVVRLVTAYLELTNTLELRVVVSAHASESARGLVARQQVALLLQRA